MATVNGSVLAGLLNAYLRLPVAAIEDASGGMTTIPTMVVNAQGNVDTSLLQFIPSLSPAEQAILADLALMAQFTLTSNLTLAEFQALKPSLAIGKQIVAAPTGTVLTAAQNLASHQAMWKVIGALLRS